jgi:hypothetical protein
MDAMEEAAREIIGLFVVLSLWVIGWSLLGAIVFAFFFVLTNIVSMF